jgi:hypothetical protein
LLNREKITQEAPILGHLPKDTTALGASASSMSFLVFGSKGIACWSPFCGGKG